MKFGPVPLDQAEGAVLAHSIRVADSSGAQGRGYRIAKGTVLNAQHLADLAAGDVQEVIVARLGPTDVPENDAARRLAAAIVPDPAGQCIRIGDASTGRVNLFAAVSGIADIDVAAVNALNAIDPMITIATVPAFHRSDADGMIATIKIISYGVTEAGLRRAEAAGAHGVRVRSAVFGTATLIETTIGGVAPSDKGRAAMAGRLDRLGVALGPRVLVPHDAPPLAEAIRQAPGDLVFVLTGSATSDENDVAPAGLRLAGGQVTRFGMPVDPGNLLFLGKLGEKPVIGLPGCARSPALNGADWVLERVICGVPVSGADIAAMGVGGLLKEIPTRPQPRRAP